MSEPIKPSAAQRNEHSLPAGKNVAGHEIVVEGFYWAWNEHDGKLRRKYSEKFKLSPREKALHAQGALSHILSDHLLAAVLAKKDPEFRAIATHAITRHENILVDAPEPEPEPETPEQEAEAREDGEMSASSDL